MPDEAGSQNTCEVFLSFSRKDYDAVIAFKQLLADAGVPVWFDEERIEGGEKWRESIARAIEGCKVVILAATQNSVDTPVVQRELLYARGENVAVILVYLQDPKTVTLPRQLKFEFGSEHFLHQDPQADRVDFALLRTLAKSHDVRSTVYDDHLAGLNARNAETLQQIDLLPDLLDRTGQTRAYQIFVSQGQSQSSPAAVPGYFSFMGPNSSSCRISAAPWFVITSKPSSKRKISPAVPRNAKRRSKSPGAKYAAAIRRRSPSPWRSASSSPARRTKPRSLSFSRTIPTVATLRPFTSLWRRGIWEF